MVDFFKRKDIIHLEKNGECLDIAVLTGTEEIVIQQKDQMVTLPISVANLMASLLKG